MKPPAGMAGHRLEAFAAVDWFIVGRETLDVRASDQAAIEEELSHSTV